MIAGLTQGNTEFARLQFNDDKLALTMASSRLDVTVVPLDDLVQPVYGGGAVGVAASRGHRAPLVGVEVVVREWEHTRLHRRPCRAN